MRHFDIDNLPDVGPVIMRPRIKIMVFRPGEPFTVSGSDSEHGLDSVLVCYLDRDGMGGPVAMSEDELLENYELESV